MLANQVRLLLQQFDFHESTGYDYICWLPQGIATFTRLVGTLPAEYLQSLPAEFGKQPIDQVPAMVKDLRTQPTGWFTPSIERESLPDPVRAMVPIVVTEVLPEPEPAKDLPRAEKRGQSYLDKISDDLWNMVVSKDDDIKVVRVEIVLAFTPPAGDESYRALLNREASTLIIEGRLGPLALCVAPRPAFQPLRAFCRSMSASPAPALVHADPSLKFPADNAKALEQSGLAALHQSGARGQGIRIGIIDSDFRGYKDFVNNGKLPKGTRLVDLTTAYNPDMYGDQRSG